MSPLINKKDKFILSPLCIGIKNPFTGNYLFKFTPLKRNSIVVFSLPNYKENIDILDSFLSFITFSFYNKYSYKDSSLIIREIVGIEGDTIFIKNFNLYRKTNGKIYLLKKDVNTFVEGSNISNEILLGKDEYFMMSYDNSYIDSNYFGVININNIKSILLMQYYPLKNFIKMNLKIKNYKENFN